MYFVPLILNSKSASPCNFSWQRIESEKQWSTTCCTWAVRSATLLHPVCALQFLFPGIYLPMSKKGIRVTSLQVRRLTSNSRRGHSRSQCVWDSLVSNQKSVSSWARQTGRTKLTGGFPVTFAREVDVYAFGKQTTQWMFVVSTADNWNERIKFVHLNFQSEFTGWKSNGLHLDAKWRQEFMVWNTIGHSASVQVQQE